MKEELAKEFSRLLREVLTKNEFSKLVQLEKNSKEKTICHSHDFCDPNAVMLEAFENVHKREADVSMASEDIGTMCEAWWEAQTNLFYS